MTAAAPFQVCGPLTDDECAALRESIRDNGVLVKVVYTHDGRIVDGHHRVALAESLGVDFEREVLTERGDDEYLALAITLNADRRQLTREQRRDLVAKAIRAQPEKSDRAIAKQTGVSHPTVADVRTELEDAGDVESLSTRTDSLGRQQPATKPTPPADHECQACGERFPHAVWHCGECGQHWNAAREKTCRACHPDTAVVDLATGEALSEHEPSTRNPIAEAKAEVARQPAILAAKAIDRLIDATKTIAAAGGADAVLADLTDPDADALGHLWLGFIDDAFSTFEPLRVGLRRRNLRSVQ